MADPPAYNAPDYHYMYCLDGLQFSVYFVSVPEIPFFWSSFTNLIVIVSLSKKKKKKSKYFCEKATLIVDALVGTEEMENLEVTGR